MVKCHREFRRIGSIRFFYCKIPDDKNSITYLVVACKSKSGSLNSFDQIIYPFQHTIVIIVFKRIFYVCIVFMIVLMAVFI